HLHLLDLASQPVTMTFAVIDLDGAADTIAVGRERLEAAAHHGQDRVQLAFQRGAHRMQMIIESAGGDDLQTAGDVGTYTLAFAQRRHAEIEQDHVATLPRSWFRAPNLVKLSAKTRPLVIYVGGDRQARRRHMDPTIKHWLGLWDYLD